MIATEVHRRLISDCNGVIFMNVSFESWRAACKMVKCEKGRLRSYLQWLPFYVMNEREWAVIESEGFFDRYISDGSFILCERMRFSENGLIQKSGFAFRDSRLVSPTIYLYLLAFSIEYERIFSPSFKNDVTFYSGDIARRRLHYRKSYRAYCQALKICSSEYKWCVKTDLAHFYESISVDGLVAAMIKLSDGGMTLPEAQFFRGLLLYCGKRGFPIIQNHAGLSFLATEVYLNDVDESFSKQVNHMRRVGDFCMVRYVDDLYIFFNASDEDAFDVGCDIAGIYADVLRQKGLSLNPSKTRFFSAHEAAKTAAEVSTVDFLGLDPDEDLPDETWRLGSLFSGIATRIREKAYTESSLDELIGSLFSFEGVSIDPKSALRRYLFSKPDLFRSRCVIEAIGEALKLGRSIFVFMTEEVVIALLNTRNEGLIKLMLNNLFDASRSGSWTSIDSLVAVTYLRNRGVEHSDLLACLMNRAPEVYAFLDYFCMRGSRGIEASNRETAVIDVLSGETESKVQYVAHLYHKLVGNDFEASAYYRAFFDRFTSYVSGKKRKRGRPKMLYKEETIKKIYNAIPGSDVVVGQAEDYRRKNPLVHAGAEMLQRVTLREDLGDSTENLRQLICSCVDERIAGSKS